MIYYNKQIQNFREAINFLKWCRTVHWRYTKNPKLCRGNSGNVDHHAYAVRKYDEIIKLLKFMSRQT
jgi:hypothetical protein